MVRGLRRIFVFAVVHNPYVVVQIVQSSGLCNTDDIVHYNDSRNQSTGHSPT